MVGTLIAEMQARLGLVSQTTPATTDPRPRTHAARSRTEVEIEMDTPGGDPSRLGLLSLPAEIRNIIYSLVLPARPSPNSCAASASRNPVSVVSDPRALALLATCRRIRADAAGMYYARPEGFALPSPLESDAAVRWLRGLAGDPLSGGQIRTVAVEARDLMRGGGRFAADPWRGFWAALGRGCPNLETLEVRLEVLVVCEMFGEKRYVLSGLRGLEEAFCGPAGRLRVVRFVDLPGKELFLRQVARNLGCRVQEATREGDEMVVRCEIELAERQDGTALC